MLFSYLLLVLHPHHKLQYFKNAGWEEDWIERVEEIVHTEFDKSYRSLDTSWMTSRRTGPGLAKVRLFILLSYIIVLLPGIDIINKHLRRSTRSSST